jgi:hypothetical protein
MLVGVMIDPKLGIESMQVIILNRVLEIRVIDPARIARLARDHAADALADFFTSREHPIAVVGSRILNDLLFREQLLQNCPSSDHLGQRWS